MAEEILELILEDVFTKAEREFQDREFNYVFEITTWDPDTGEIIMDHEFRTYATDDQLSDAEALAEAQDAFTDLYGSAQGA